MGKGQASSPAEESRALLDEVRAGEVLPAYLFIGEFPVTAEHVNGLINLLVGPESAAMNVQELSGDEAAPGRCVEFLETRSFFPGRKVLLVKEPSFFHSASTVPARWKSVVSAIDKGEHTRAARTVSQLLGLFKLSVAEILELNTDDFEENLKWPAGLSVDALKKFLREKGGGIMPSANIDKGDMDILLRWLREKADASRSALVVQADAVDRRGTIFKAFKSVGRIIDFNLPGDAKKARGQAASTVRQLFSRHGMVIEPRALELLMDLAGEDNIPALMKETEKLVSMSGFGRQGQKRVTSADVKRLVSHQREEELFRLTGAIGRQDMQGAVESLHLLLDQGIYPLAVLGTLNNYLKKMLAISAAAAATVGNDTLRQAQYNRFRDGLLPKLEAFYQESEEKPLKGHPYALYMQCRGADVFSVTRILELISLMPEVDLELKGGASDPRTVLELLVMNMAGGK